MAKAFGAEDSNAGFQVSSPVAAQSRGRVRHRGAADPRRRRSLGVARERDDDLDCDPQSARAADRRAGAGRAGAVASCSAPSIASARARHGDAAHARRVARAPRPRPAAAPARRVPSGSPTRSVACAIVCPHAAVERVGGGVRIPRDGLHDLDRRRPHDRRRNLWVIVFNADVLLGLSAATSGRFASLAPVLRMSIAYPLARDSAPG